MSTRSYIFCKCKDGRVRGVFHHWDGYPTGVGQTLRDHYSKSHALVECIMTLGNIETLRENINETETHAKNRIAQGLSPYLEDNAIEGNSVEDLLKTPDMMCIEFAYYWDGEDWFCVDLASEEHQLWSGWVGLTTAIDMYREYEERNSSVKPYFIGVDYGVSDKSRTVRYDLYR